MTGKTFNCNGDNRYYYPQKIENVCIYNNFVTETGLDAIQLGSCIAGGRIFDNFCVDYGTIGDGGMSNGIQMGLGCRGAVCERNFVRQSAEQSEDFGHGIFLQGAGNNCIQNNIVYNTQENAIYTAEQYDYFYAVICDTLMTNTGDTVICTKRYCDPVLEDGSSTCVGFEYIDTTAVPLTGARIVHNTFALPAG